MPNSAATPTPAPTRPYTPVLYMFTGLGSIAMLFAWLATGVGTPVLPIVSIIGVIASMIGMVKDAPNVPITTSNEHVDDNVEYPEDTYV